jgi:hypothetical protein
MLGRLMATAAVSKGAWSRRWSTPLVLLGVAVCCASLPAVSLAATKAPEVGYLPASSVSTTGATIEVPIDPEGGETSYEIWLTCQSARESNQACGPLTVESQHQQGVLAAGFEQRTVTDPVTGLQPDYLYEYEVVASNSDGREGYIGDGFITCPPQKLGELCPRQPFLEGTSLWVWEGATREANEAPSIGEREAREHREAEERPAKEAAERAAHEREIRETGERAGRETAEREVLAKQASTTMCVVPSLKGDSLTAARRALGKAHCKLGKVSKLRGHHKTLLVTSQSAKSGKTLADGAAIAVKLGPTRG